MFPQNGDLSAGEGLSCYQSWRGVHGHCCCSSSAAASANIAACPFLELCDISFEVLTSTDPSWLSAAQAALLPAQKLSVANNTVLKVRVPYPYYRGFYAFTIHVQFRCGVHTC